MVDVDVIIQPVVLRFSLSDDEIVYHFAAGADAQLDRMEQLLGVDPQKQRLFDSNVGFLPVASTVLVRGERNLVFDPGNHHTGFYGQLGLALAARGLAPDDIDIVVTSHTHHDHFASAAFIGGDELVVGEGELAEAREGYGPHVVEHVTSRYARVIEVPEHEIYEAMPGVSVISTPGHTAGHVALLVETEDERWLATGDAAMTRVEYETGELSHWYPPEQRKRMLRSLDAMRALKPTMVIPGHDRAFRVGS